MKSPLIMLCILLCCLSSCSSDKRITVRHLLPENFSGKWECIVYGVEGAQPLEKVKDTLTADIPQDGILLTSTEFPSGGCDDAFYYELSGGGLGGIPDEYLQAQSSLTGSIQITQHGIDCDFHATWVGRKTNATSLEKLKIRITEKLISHYEQMRDAKARRSSSERRSTL